MAGSDIETTHSEHGGDGALLEQGAWLTHIGSAENGFAGAGKSFRIDGVGKVRIGRSLTPGQLEHERDGGVLYLGVPIGWVSGVHCELQVVDAEDGFEFHLRDLHSRNGTHIEGVPVTQARLLRPRQVFEAGRSFWTVNVTSGACDASMGLPAPDLGLQTASPLLRHAVAGAHRLAASDIAVLIRGETGSGKEDLARRIHGASGRSGHFIRAHLGAFSAARVESLLFGAHDGTGSLFEQARSGTLFLDDVGELGADAQLKLVGALSDGVMQGLRLVCATTRNLRDLVVAGEFRADLYSRIAGFEIEVPPLRHRREDLGLLVGAMARGADGAHVPVATRAFRRILAESWPFNLRQLSQTMTACTILASGPGVVTRDVLEEVLGGGSKSPDRPDEIQRLRERLVQALSQTGGDVDAVAESFGYSRRVVEQWLNRFDLSPRLYRH